MFVCVYRIEEMVLIMNCSQGDVPCFGSVALWFGDGSAGWIFCGVSALGVVSIRSVVDVFSEAWTVGLFAVSSFLSTALMASF